MIRKVNNHITLSQNGNKNCIEVTNLKKQYRKDKAYILDSISFMVKYGTVFGFLGPNGAGKTTTIKILTSLLNPSSGTVCIFGKDLFKNQAEIKRKIGVVSQNPSFEANLTVERSLDLYGLLWGLNDSKARKYKVKEILKTFDLESIKNSKNDELSIGQRRRVQLAREFMHDMDLLFLDEPTVGLDPSARRMLLDYIKKHVMSGLTVFFTTHIMEEAEYLCDDIAIIDKGRIIAFDTPMGLKQKYGRMNKTIEITFKDTLNESFVEILKSIANGSEKDNKSPNYDFNNGISQINVKGTNTISIRVNNTEKVISEIFQVVPKNGMQIENISVNSPSLEEIFLSIVNNSKDNSDIL
ncbi:MAG TPA: ABC transporter ATP-binding protein [Nitrososphaeraceae archaeon]|nr:ABC transporter ATP-binding protein [Nitrososphaeraceae archaeon]